MKKRSLHWFLLPHFANGNFFFLFLFIAAKEDLTIAAQVTPSPSVTLIPHPLESISPTPSPPGYRTSIPLNISATPPTFVPLPPPPPEETPLATATPTVVASMSPPSIVPPPPPPPAGSPTPTVVVAATPLPIIIAPPPPPPEELTPTPTVPVPPPSFIPPPLPPPKETPPAGSLSSPPPVIIAPPPPPPEELTPTPTVPVPPPSFIPPPLPPTEETPPAGKLSSPPPVIIAPPLPPPEVTPTVPKPPPSFISLPPPPPPPDFSCGNGIVEEPEECDNGPSPFVDGCNNTCHVEPFFECTGRVGELSVCQHVAIDFNVPDQTTLDPPVVPFTQPDVEVFLVETPEFLDASKIRNEEWSRIVVQLVIDPAARFRENIVYLRSNAVLNNRLTEDEFSALDGAVTYSGGVRSGGIKTFELRREQNKPANLTHVLLSLVFDHSRQEVIGEFRFALVSVEDINGNFTPTVNVSLRFVGQNENSPNVTIQDNMAQFVEGTTQPVSLTKGTLKVEDADSDFYPIVSAVVRLVSRGPNDEFLLERLHTIAWSSSISFHFNKTSGELLFTGRTSTEEYARLLNGLTYFNSNPDVGALPFTFRLIEFSVSDGDNEPGSAIVTMHFVNVNDAPVVSLDGQLSVSMLYREGNPPTRIPSTVNVSDSDDTHMDSASAILTQRQDGDVISLAASPHSLSVDTTVSVNGDLHLTVSGYAPINVYEYLLSSLQFHNELPSPVLLNPDTRVVIVNVSDGMLSSNSVFITVTVIPVNDGPVLQFVFDADPTKNRFRRVGYKEESAPVLLVPNTTSLRDADSSNLTNVTVDLLNILDRGKERVSVDEDVANSLGITVSVVYVSNSSLRLVVLCYTSPDRCRKLLLTLQYENREDVEPVEGTRSAVLTATDSSGASSLNATVDIVVMRRNDRPSLDLGVGVGVVDTVTFKEIPKGQHGVGIHVVSSPHRVVIVDEESLRHHIVRTIIQLRAGGCGELGDEEFIYPLAPPMQPLTIFASDDGKGLIIETHGTVQPSELDTIASSFEQFVADVRYIDLGDEPVLYCWRNNIRTMLERYIDFTIVDSGTPSANSTATSRVITQPVNDNPPEISVESSGECVVEPSPSGPVRQLFGHLAAARKKRDTRNALMGPKRKAPTVLMVEAVKPSYGMIQTGSSVVVKFSHDTNTPVVTRSDDLKRIMTMSPPELEQFPHMTYWQDKRTLVILFMAVGKEEKVHTADIVIKFTETDVSQIEVDLCYRHICHVIGPSYSVNGSYAVNFAMNHGAYGLTGGSNGGATIATAIDGKASNSGDMDIEQTQLHDWSLLSLAAVCFVVSVTVVIVAGGRWTRIATKVTK